MLISFPAPSILYIPWVGASLLFFHIFTISNKKSNTSHMCHSTHNKTKNMHNPREITASEINIYKFISNSCQAKCGILPVFIY